MMRRFALLAALWCVPAQAELTPSQQADYDTAVAAVSTVQNDAAEILANSSDLDASQSARADLVEVLRTKYPTIVVPPHPTTAQIYNALASVANATKARYRPILSIGLADTKERGCAAIRKARVAYQEAVKANVEAGGSLAERIELRKALDGAEADLRQSGTVCPP